MNFGNWDSTIHKSPDQVSRICAGQKILPSQIQLSTNKDSAAIYGSSFDPYIVTVNSCTCADFTFRGLPCKHIYAYAICAGIITDLPVYNANAANSFDAEIEIERFYKLYENGSITGEQFHDLAVALKKNVNTSKSSFAKLTSKPNIVNEKNITGPFSGMTFVITGSLLNYSRDEIASVIENLGGVISSSVSKNTSIVIAGENAGSKLSKAQELGLTVINEIEFANMLLRLK